MATVVTTGGYQPTTTTTIIKEEPSAMRRAIPQLPVPLAAACCVINFVLPGIGTIIAGASVFCCGNVGESDASKIGTFCMNLIVGLLQMLTVVFFLFGWVWSIMWGYAILAMSGTSEGGTTVITTNNAVGPHQPATVNVIHLNEENPAAAPAPPAYVEPK